MVEDVDADARIVRAGQKCVARSQTGAEDAELGVALLGKPIEATADVGDGLAGSVNGAAHVGADSVVGARELGGAADIVVGHAEAQSRDAKPVEGLAERVVADGIGVPMRQHNNGPPSPLFLGRGKPASVGQIVFWKRRFHRRGEAQEFGLLLAILGLALRIAAGGEELDGAALQADIRGRAIREKLGAVLHDVLV